MKLVQLELLQRGRRGATTMLLLLSLLLALLVRPIGGAAAAAARPIAAPAAAIAAFVGPSSLGQRQQQRAARLRMHGRKKRAGAGGRGGGGGGGTDGGSSSSSRPGPSRGKREDSGENTNSGTSKGRSSAPSSLVTTPATSAARSISSVASLLSRSDKYGVLRTIEGLPERELAGSTLATAWDRLAQRTVAAGPRAPHLPPLHLDRAFHLLLERTWQRLPSLAPGHCASVASSLAKLRYRPEDAFLSDLLASCLAQAEGQSFGTAARLAASLARLDYDFGGGSGTQGEGGKGELAALAGAMRERLVMATDIETLHPESLAMGLWALAVLGALQQGGGGGGGSGGDDLRERLLAASIARLRAAHAAATVGGGGLAEGRGKDLVRVCRQLRTALLFLPASAAAAGGAEAACLSAQEELGHAIATVWEDLEPWLDPVRRSRLQLEVESALRAGGGSPAGEWGDGVVTVDIALHPREGVEWGDGGGEARPVALEVDGPSHFFLNQPQRPTGDTRIKHQALHVGYPHQWAAVISIPHFEWPRLEKHRLDLLRKKLAQAGLEPAHFLAARKNGGGGGGGGKK